MSGGQNKFTTREIIDLWDRNYGIPVDGEGSNISPEHSEPDIDAEQADFDSELSEIGEHTEVLDNLHTLEIVDEEGIASTIIYFIKGHQTGLVFTTSGDLCHNIYMFKKMV
ncbi:Hypothetical predicted protein [Paramuricea clavata]|uniref:Uncharacterized protein n=1 Tax=Paramuricea clavata TaxID=317549 RepID=A0A6S7GGU4_PARCT|nr:Hypothetical predicted protein [Paramuricea clavata]